MANKCPCRIFLVGGYIRDALIFDKRKAQHTETSLAPFFKPKDLDYAVADASAFAFAHHVSLSIGGHFVALDEENDTARVVLNDGTTLDFAGCVGGQIESDILRRDFTINALYWDPEKPDMVNDLVGGIEDIANKQVRAIAREAFIDDPLRLLRAFRFAALLDFKIEETTANWIKEEHKRIKQVAAERVSLELFSAFAVHKSEAVLWAMAKCGLLEDLLPELSPTRQIPQNSHHHLGLFEHSIETLVQAEKILQSSPIKLLEKLDEEISFGVTRFAATKVAALLHDIGKPKTWKVTEEGKHTFIGHETLGFEMISDIAARLKWARTTERLIAKLVKWHLRPGQLFHNGQPTVKAVHRFYRQVGRDLPELIILSLADLQATQGPALLGDKTNVLRQNLIELFNGYFVFMEEVEQIPKILDGKDVMRVLQLSPGPIVGDILKMLEEAQGINQVTNRAQAEHFIKVLYKQMRPNQTKNS